MSRTACTEPQYLYGRAISLLPLWAVRPVHSLSACTRVTFTLFIKIFAFYRFISSILFWHWGPMRAMSSSCTRFLDHTQQRITVCRTPLDERSAHSRYLYLTTHSTRNRQTDRQTSVPLAGFEPTTPIGERPQNLRLRPRGYWDRLLGPHTIH
jgi:hypothetical protein